MRLAVQGGLMHYCWRIWAAVSAWRKEVRERMESIFILIVKAMLTE